MDLGDSLTQCPGLRCAATATGLDGKQRSADTPRVGEDHKARQRNGNGQTP